LLLVVGQGERLEAAMLTTAAVVEQVDSLPEPLCRLLLVQNIPLLLVRVERLGLMDLAQHSQQLLLPVVVEVDLDLRLGQPEDLEAVALAVAQAP
jgi:hypothetical protein